MDPVPARTGPGSGHSRRPGKVPFLPREDTRPVEKDFTRRGIPKFTVPHCRGRPEAQYRARLPLKTIMITGEPCAQMAESRLGGLIPEPRPIRR